MYIGTRAAITARRAVIILWLALVVILEAVIIFWPLVCTFARKGIIEVWVDIGNEPIQYIVFGLGFILFHSLTLGSYYGLFIGRFIGLSYVLLSSLVFGFIYSLTYTIAGRFAAGLATGLVIGLIVGLGRGLFLVHVSRFLYHLVAFVVLGFLLGLGYGIGALTGGIALSFILGIVYGIFDYVLDNTTIYYNEHRNVSFDLLIRYIGHGVFTVTNIGFICAFVYVLLGSHVSGLVLGIIIASGMFLGIFLGILFAYSMREVLTGGMSTIVSFFRLWDLKIYSFGRGIVFFFTVFAVVVLVFSLWFYSCYLEDSKTFFSIQRVSTPSLWHFFYFSFAAVTSLNYNDISPLHIFPQVLTILETIMGMAEWHFLKGKCNPHQASSG